MVALCALWNSSWWHCASLGLLCDLHGTSTVRSYGTSMSAECFHGDFHDSFMETSMEISVVRLRMVLPWRFHGDFNGDFHGAATSMGIPWGWDFHFHGASTSMGFPPCLHFHVTSMETSMVLQGACMVPSRGVLPSDVHGGTLLPFGFPWSFRCAKRRLQHLWFVNGASMCGVSVVCSF